MLLGVSVGISVVLHSLINQLGPGIFLGIVLPVPQDLIMSGLFVLSAVVFVLFLGYKGRIKRNKKSSGPSSC